MVDSSEIYLLSGKFIIGILIFIRIGGIFIFSPLFSHISIPNLVKILLPIIISISLTEATWKEQATIDLDLWYLVLLALKEFTVGVLIGFAANTVFWAARLAGGIIDFDMGYQASMLFTAEEAPTLVGEFKFLIVLMLFLLMNGHHFIIESLFVSVRAVPIGTMEITESTVQLLIRLVTTVFILGVKMTAPMIISLFLTNLALALLARVAPQTNIFSLSFQLKIAVGLVVLFLSITLFGSVAKLALDSMEKETLKIVMSINPKRV